MKLYQEADAIPGQRVTASFLAVVVAIIVGTVAAYWLGLAFRAGRPGPGGLHGDGASRDVVPEVNAIERTLFDQAPGLEERVQARRALETYGWVDREAGLVHIPIERALEMHLQGWQPERPPEEAPEEAPERMPEQAPEQAPGRVEDRP